MSRGQGTITEIFVKILFRNYFFNNTEKIKKRAVSGSLFEYNYLYFLLRAASDFFLRFTLGFS